MPLQKHNPSAVLLVEVDADGKVVWAYDYKNDAEGDKITIGAGSKAPTIMNALLKTEGGFGGTGSPQEGFGCRWVNVGGYPKCI